MKIIEVKVEKGADKAAVAQEIGKAIANAIADGDNDGDEDDHAIDDTIIEADSLDKEGLAAMCETEEFKKFREEAIDKMNDLLEFFAQNKPKYGCSLVVGATFAHGKDTNRGQAGACGRGDSVQKSLRRIFSHKALKGMAIATALQQLHND